MLTVLLATHNGARTLPTTLESFTQLQAPEGGWQLIVVDNNSVDATPAILEGFREHLPLRILFEEKRGKNVALNSAIPHVEGDLIVFTDDDVVVPSDWLVKFRKLAEENPRYAIFGGKIIPLWPGEEPLDIIRSVPVSPAFAVHPDDLSDGPVVPDMIWGPNMLVRRKLFDEGHRFNEAVGPAAGAYMMGSETDFIVRMYEVGCLCYFSSDIVVQHIIRKEQLSLDWLRARAFRYGRAHFFRKDKTFLADGPTILGYPRWRLRQLIGEYIRVVVNRLKRDRQAVFLSTWELGFSLGWLAEARRAKLQG